MKVGNLIMLSAYGKKLKSNKSVEPQELGIIVGQLGLAFIIRWSEYSKTHHYGKTHDPAHFRNELKYAK